MTRKLTQPKDIIQSKTVWALILAATIGLFGMNITPESTSVASITMTRAVCSILLVVVCLFGILSRILATNKLVNSAADNNMGALIVLPILLSVALTGGGCIKDTGQTYSPLETATIAVDTLNDSFIPARQAYEDYYKMASPEVRDVLNNTVNPAVNKATDALIVVTTLLIKWHSLQKPPEDYDKAYAEAEALVKQAVIDMTAATKMQ